MAEQTTEAATRQVPQMYKADTPEPEPETTEVETPETDEVETGAETDETTETADAAEATQEGEGDSEDKPNEHNRDKGLQKFQQRLSAIERQNQERFDQLTELIKSVQQKPVDPEAKPAEAAQQEQQKADDFAQLDQMLEDLEDDGIVEGAQLKQVVRMIRDAAAQQTPKQQDNTVEELRQEIRSIQARHEAEVVERQFYESFDRDHPELSGRGKELVDQANDLVDKQYAYLAESPEARQGALNAVFDQLVAQEKGKAKPSTRSRTKPASDTPTRSTEGTQTVPEGASASRATTGGQKSKPPMWKPDN